MKIAIEQQKIDEHDSQYRHMQILALTIVSAMLAVASTTIVQAIPIACS